MIKINNFIEKTKDNKTIKIAQAESGIYWVEIENEYGIVDSAATRLTMQEVYQWINERT